MEADGELAIGKNVNYSSVDLCTVDPNLRMHMITKLAEHVRINPRISIERYYRSGADMVTLAFAYLEKGYYEDAYVLLLRFTILFKQLVPTHPDYKSYVGDERRKVELKLSEIDKPLLILRHELMGKYVREFEAFKETGRKAFEIVIPRERWSTISDDGYLLYPPQQDFQERNSRSEDPADLGATGKRAIEITAGGNQEIIAGGNRSQSRCLGTIAPTQSFRSSCDHINTPWSSVHDVFPEKQRSKITLTNYPVKMGQPTLVIPHQLTKEFLIIAQSNTQKNIETMAYICGNEECSSEISITHLILPKQVGNMNTCGSRNEEEVCEYQTKHNLFLYGWIHTHPRQTAYLSSIDVHTQCVLQRMNPLAIAIVCAPARNETLFANLTEEGMRVVGKCSKGGFHDHQSKGPLYKRAANYRLDTSRLASLKVVDLR